ncbi:MAG: hypothetical protein U0869_10525 [Chloroflexota bacterium]
MERSRAYARGRPPSTHDYALDRDSRGVILDAAPPKGRLVFFRYDRTDEDNP